MAETPLDTIAIAARTLIDMDETIEQIVVRRREGQTEETISGWRCRGCGRIHIDLEERRPWESTDEMFDDRRCM